MRFTMALALAITFSIGKPTMQAVDSPELTGGPDGQLHLLVDGTERWGIVPFCADGQWKFTFPTAIQTATDTPFHFTLKIGHDIISGEVATVEKDGTIDVAWTLTPANDVSFNGLGISTDVSIASLAGGSWEVDGHRGVFPLVFHGAKVFAGEASALTVGFPDGQNVKMTFSQPVTIGLQDNRQWSGQTFNIRIGKVGGRMAANEHFGLAMNISVPQGLRYRRDLPVNLAAGDDWIPLQNELDIVPGSALDLSACGLIDGPCGAKGRVVTTPDGHFVCTEDSKNPRRFYGVNLCFSALYLPKEQVDQLLDRLVRMGYNTVRIHHYEYRLTSSDWKPGFVWDPAHVDKLDYLMAGCAKRGLWMTTDLYVSRAVPGTQIGLSGNRLSPDRFKSLVPVYEPAFQDWATFARKFLDRVNPYTGMRVADDPALAWISLINEGPITNLWSEAKNIPEWTGAWNRWLAKNFTDRNALKVALGELADKEDPAAGSVVLPGNLKDGSKRARTCQVFIADTERTMLDRMRNLLRDELKCQALLTDMNNAGPTPVTLQAVRADFDYVDDHFYVDHPVFIEKPWQLPSRSLNANPIRDGAPGGRSSASLRVWGKPFAISEFNYSGPGRFRGVGGILTGALAALQDWDVVWRFAYSHRDVAMFTPAPIDYFNLANDPLNLAADRAAVLLFLRRDLKASQHSLAVTMPQDALRNPSGQLSLTGAESYAWTTRIGCAVGDNGKQAPADTVSVPLESASDAAAVGALLRERKLLPEESGQLIHSDTGELTIDRKLGVLTIDTPRTAGGYADAGQSISAIGAGVHIDGITTGATLFVNSLESAPIHTAKRILVTHLTDLQNTGARYGESARQTLLEWGSLPHLMREGTATVHISLDEPAAYNVWALSTGGRRLGKVPATVETGTLTFQVQVKRIDGACILYEVAK